MGKALDPLDLIKGSSHASQLLDPIGGDPLGLGKLFKDDNDGGWGKSIESVMAAAAAQVQAAPPDPNLKPFNRPALVPDSEELKRADRRRSISSAMRRRAASSILTSTTAAADTLGG